MSAPRPMPDVPDRVWTESEWQRIQHGYRAGSMDEKWNIYAEDDRLFLHRSWTGFLAYEATFTKVEGGGRRITAALVESDPERYRSASSQAARSPRAALTTSTGQTSSRTPYRHSHAFQRVGRA